MVPWERTQQPDTGGKSSVKGGVFADCRVDVLI